MKIEEHILQGVNYAQAASGVGTITPKFLVIHCTDTWDAQGAIDIFQDASTRVSAHIVLGRDGVITQMLPFNQKANHAGKSFWRGYTDLNAHSIGVEIVNYGGTPLFDHVTRIPLTREGASMHRHLDNDGPAGAAHKWIQAIHPLDQGKQPMLWQKYTAPQFEVLDLLVPLLVDTYNLRDVVGHEDIAIPSGRKDDPGPAFPLDHYRKFADHGNAGGEGRYLVVSEDLNVRGGPGTSFSVIGKLLRGDSVKVLKFDEKWALIVHGTARAWVHGSFLMKA
jgi:N-acetylmuramoyl-L-alanine amidase